MSRDAEAALISAARDSEPVRGLTHAFYKYPARFSPIFARTAIETFTRPGDVVLDPHVGGGTTLVEALACGREAVGIDISALAEFVTSVKTTIYSNREIERLQRWAKTAASSINMHQVSSVSSDYAQGGYHRHLTTSQRWRLRKAVEQALKAATQLPDTRTEDFARCVILRTAQWALDSRKRLPTISEFRETLSQNATTMIDAAVELKTRIECFPTPPRVLVINRSAAGLENDRSLSSLTKPRLIVTSPPYPGVHVLYHRWQVDGRKESAAPFWIAKRLDGSGGSFYTMGDRKQQKLRAYFENIRATMTSVAAVVDRGTVLVQMVAFTQPRWQLPRFIQVMSEAGFEERKLTTLGSIKDGRLWRTVPNRKWHADQKGATSSSQEVVLFFVRA